MLKSFARIGCPYRKLCPAQMTFHFRRQLESRYSRVRTIRYYKCELRALRMEFLVGTTAQPRLMQLLDHKQDQCDAQQNGPLFEADGLQFQDV